jgi:hypothetical protein
MVQASTGENMRPYSKKKKLKQKELGTEYLPHKLQVQTPVLPKINQMK